MRDNLKGKKFLTQLDGQLRSTMLLAELDSVIPMSEIQGVCFPRGAFDLKAAKAIADWYEITLSVIDGKLDLDQAERDSYYENMAEAGEFDLIENSPSLSAPLNLAVKHYVNRYLDMPVHLTKNCELDQELACGKCGSCQERIEAFALNGMVDPILYEPGD